MDEAPEEAYALRLGRAESQIGHRFRNRQLLLRALTHRSSGPAHNERLEFFGDALLDAIIAEALYRRFPDEREGNLSGWRAALVNGRALASLMRERAMDECLVLGRSIQRIHDSPSVLANAFEALVAAVYLDAGYAACRSFVLGWYGERLDAERLLNLDADAKTRLQKRMQALGLALPCYVVLTPRPFGASRRIAVRCEIVVPGQGQYQTTASAGTRRDAEQLAAAALLDDWDDASEEPR